MSNTTEREEIRDLNLKEQCRMRISTFYGSRDNYYHGVREVLANALDEILNNYDSGFIHMKIDDDLQTLILTDTGRGIPIGGQTNGENNYIKLFCRLFSGTNFSNMAKKRKATGMNGVGTTVLNHTSLIFECESYYDGIKHVVKFKDGGEFVSYNEYKIQNGEMPHGSIFKFKLDPDVYTETRYELNELKLLMDRLASTTNRITCTVNYDNEKTIYHYDTTIEYLEEKIENKLCDYIVFPEKTYINMVKDDDTGKMMEEEDTINLTFNLSTQPFQETYLNGTYLIEKGMIYDGIIDGIKTFFNKCNKKIKLTPQDIIMSFNIYGSISSTNAEFTNQTKFSTAKSLYKTIVMEYVQENLAILQVEKPKLFEQIKNHLAEINKLNVKSEDTIRNLKKRLNEKTNSSGIKKIKNLIECQCKDRTKNILCICEGKSALSSILSGRDETQAIFPLRGKILNCLKASDDKIYKNDVILGLLESLGADVIVEKGKPKIIFPPEKLRYSKVYIMTDFDFDGIGSILPLVLTVFYKLMPQLLHEGRIYLCETPKYEIVINKTEEELHAFSDEQLSEILKDLPKNSYTLHYIKGLAELSENSISLCLSGKMGNAKQLLMGDVERTIQELNLWMGDEIEPRKNYIMEHYGEGDVSE